MAMLRYNSGKAPLSLVPTAFFNALTLGGNFLVMPTLLLDDVSHVLAFGARKYDANNWRKGTDWLEVVDSALRHLTNLARGETHDAESGLHHIAHAACNIAFLLEFIDQGLGTDNRHVGSPRLVTLRGTPNLSFDLAFQQLLSWRDGGASVYLENAARCLADYYQDLDEHIRAPVPGTSPHATIKVTIN